MLPVPHGGCWGAGGRVGPGGARLGPCRPWRAPRVPLQDGVPGRADGGGRRLPHDGPNGQHPQAAAARGQPAPAVVPAQPAGACRLRRWGGAGGGVLQPPLPAVSLSSSSHLVLSLLVTAAALQRPPLHTRPDADCSSPTQHPLLLTLHHICTCCLPAAPLTKGFLTYVLFLSLGSFSASLTWSLSLASFPELLMRMACEACQLSWDVSQFVVPVWPEVQGYVLCLRRLVLVAARSWALAFRQSGAGGAGSLVALFSGPCFTWGLKW